VSAAESKRRGGRSGRTALDCRFGPTEKTLCRAVTLIVTELLTASTVAGLTGKGSAETREAMATERLPFTENVLGSLGLTLIGLIGWAGERPHWRALSEVLARVVVGFVAVVGWAVDRLPLSNPSSPSSRRSTAASRIHVARLRP
jgi:hypothetical protein